MMMKCETCQHWAKWSQDKLHDWELPNLGSCRKVVKYWTVVFEEAEELNEDRRKDSKFFVQDGEDYSAMLITRDDFGCVEHQGKTHEQ